MPRCVKYILWIYILYTLVLELWMIEENFQNVKKEVDFLKLDYQNIPLREM